MTENIEILLESLIDRIDRLEARIESAFHVPMAPIAKKESAKIAVSKEHIENVESSGRHYFKRDILDRLDEYFRSLECMKSCDKDAYDLYSQIGAPIMGKKSAFKLGSELPPSWRVGMKPSFGAVAVLLDGESVERWSPNIIYFQKYKLPPAGIEAAGVDETVYECTMLFCETKDGSKKGWPLSFFLAIDRHNEMRLLKEYSGWARINHKKGPGHRGFETIPQRKWKYPERIKAWHGEISSKHKQKNYKEHALNLMAMAAHANENSRLDVQVNVRDGNKSALFCIDMLRTPYFFKDRDVVVDENGTTKKIFHIVRAHERHIGPEETQFVKSHFRGIRSFIWNGYAVNISVAGKHHADILDAGFGAYDADLINSKAGSISTKKLGCMIKQNIGE